MQSLTLEPWKAPLLAHIPFSFEWALENLLVYIKDKQHCLDFARGGGELGATSGAAFARKHVGVGGKEPGRTRPTVGDEVSADK